MKSKIIFIMGLVCLFLSGGPSFQNELEAKTSVYADLGTLYGNEAGTRFCCAAGTNSCGAAECAT